VIGVDVGGTKILAGLLDREGHVERSVVHPTPTGSQDDLLDGIQRAVEEVVDDRVRAVGFGVPSQIDQRTGTLGRAVNIPLGELPFRGLMADRLGLPVAVDNDANVAAFAEWANGAARGTQTMAMLTLGTGVGGGLVLGGRRAGGRGGRRGLRRAAQSAKRSAGCRRWSRADAGWRGRARSRRGGADVAAQEVGVKARAQALGVGKMSA